ncbi:MAG: hypothetical protein ACLSCV_09395 [Acutalibacteraceae bacterium]
MGETIVVKPGEKSRWTVLCWRYFFLDTSALTGESVPREVQPESSVLSAVSITQEF